jgi:hypothetical protein
MSPSRVAANLRRRMSDVTDRTSNAWEQMLSTPRARTAPNVTTRRGSGFEDQEETEPEEEQQASDEPVFVRYGDTMVKVIKEIDPEAPPLAPGKIYDKTTRAQLSALHKSSFLQDATKLVLKKRLALPSTKTTDQLEGLMNLEYQLTTIRDHLFVFDMDDCFTILSPVNSQVTPELNADEKWNLFEDYALLEPAVVANHLMYSHRWLSSVSYVRENISYSYMFLKNNCDEALWNKCQDAYTQYLKRLEEDL